MRKEDPFSLTETAGEKRLLEIGRQKSLKKIQDKRKRVFVIAGYVAVMVMVAAYFFYRLKDLHILWGFAVTAVAGSYMLRRVFEEGQKRAYPKTKAENLLWVFMFLLLLAAAGWIVQKMAYIYSVMPD